MGEAFAGIPWTKSERREMWVITELPSRGVRILVCFGVAYSLLLFLSILVIVPHYLPGGLGGFLISELTDTELEGPSEVPLLSSLVWVIVPLTSIVLLVFSWLSYSISTGSTGLLRKLGLSGGVLFFSVSLIPALLVVRELLAYRILGATLPAAVDTLTGLVLLVQTGMHPAALLGRGAWVVPLVIFVETGLFFGFFLPGDSLLLAVGVLGAAGYLDLALVLPLSVLSALAGDQLGYAIGRRSGEVLSSRYEFVHDNIEHARVFYSKHGGKAILLARFVPVVRTFAPVVAGAARMNYVRFTFSNIAGGTLWVLGLTLGGYVIGNTVPSTVVYLDPFIVAVIVSSPLMWILAWLWERRKERHSRATGKQSNGADDGLY